MLSIILFSFVLQGVNSLTLEQALLEGNVDAIPECMDVDRVNQITIALKTPLNYAISVGNEAIVEALLAVGANPNQEFPIFTVCKWGNLNMLKTLLKHGANPLAVDPRFGMTALSAACRHENYEVGRFLLEESPVNFRLRSHFRGATALFYACGDVTGLMVDLLLEKGLNPNDTDNDGHTPLFTAAAKGNVSAMRSLLRQGANMNHKGHVGDRPLHLSALNDKMIAGGEFLIANGAEIDGANNDGMSALHLAASFCILNSVDTLIRMGADVNAPDFFGGTPLFATIGLPYNKDAIFHQLRQPSYPSIASLTNNYRYRRINNVVENRLDTIRTLAKNGANVNAADKEGTLPIDIVLRRRELHGDRSILIILIEFGVNFPTRVHLKESLSLLLEKNFQQIEHVVNPISRADTFPDYFRRLKAIHTSHTTGTYDSCDEPQTTYPNFEQAYLAYERLGYHALYELAKLNYESHWNFPIANRYRGVLYAKLFQAFYKQRESDFTSTYLDSLPLDLLQTILLDLLNPYAVHMLRKKENLLEALAMDGYFAIRNNKRPLGYDTRVDDFLFLIQDLLDELHPKL